MASNSRVFLAYPSQPPHIRETMAAAADRIGALGGVSPMPWENLHVGGRIVINQVLEAIQRSTAVIAECTHLNENVLFELGYSVGQRKRVFPLRDTSLNAQNALFDRVRILKDVGYTSYENAEDIFKAFITERPDLRSMSLFEEAVEPVLRSGTPSIVYITSAYNSDASSALTRVINSEAQGGVRLIVADPREMDNQPLVWYAQQLHDAAAVVVHFESPNRLGSDVHNPRCAFVGGLAHGMGKPVLMLALDDYSPPFDYQDLLFVYSTAADCSTRATYWLPRQLEGVREYLSRVDVERERRARSTELRTLSLGEPVAENEAGTLPDYFLPTPAFQEILAPHTAVFVGRRGSGKTALMLEAARALREDRRVLACTVTPTSYQLEGLARLLRSYAERDTRGYVIEAVWKFLLYSEIALAIVDEISSRPAGLQPNAAEWELSVFLEREGAELKGAFDIRLERAIGRLAEAAKSQGSLERERAAIVEALYKDVLGELRRLIVQAVAGRTRIAILIDDLDKAWDEKADLDELSYLLLGLLSSAPTIAEELQHTGGQQFPPVVTLGTFIRTDIFTALLRTAREPDKIPVRRIAWTDLTRLLDLLDRRYEASVGHDTEPFEIWHRHFANEVRGLATRDYMLRRILPKPRDLLILVRAAIDAAVLRGSDRVEEQDVLAADYEYSQFAFDALRVDDPSLVGRLEVGLIEFAGGPAVWDADALRELICTKMSFKPGECAQVVDELRDLSFLGIEVADSEFEFTDDPQAKRRSAVLADRLVRERGTSGPRFQVHRAFRPYLEIPDDLG